jgi:hypothetical protein
MASGDMGKQFQKFSEFLALPDTFVKDATAAADRIFELLSASQGNIDRCRIVGGLGKKTSTSVKADIDAVVFINMDIKEKTDLKVASILDEWKQVLSRGPGLENLQMETTSKTLKVNYGEISLDLLPAVNMAKDPANIEESQLKETLKYIRREGQSSPALACNLSAELAESSLTFLKQQSKFAHDFARLAKFWNQSLLYHDYVYGRSLIIETLAVHCANEEENNNREPSLDTCFKRFLEKISDIGKLNICSSVNYEMSAILPSILNQRPLLMDPTNPYNNLLTTDVGYHGGVKPGIDFHRFLSTCAMETLKRMTLTNQNAIFYPQPFYHTIQHKIGFKFDSFFVAINHYPELKGMPWLEMRKETMSEKVLSSITQCFIVLLRAVEFDRICQLVEEGLKPMVEFVEKAFFNRVPFTYLGPETTHQERDVTLHIPAVNQDQKGSKISFNTIKC